MCPPAVPAEDSERDPRMRESARNQRSSQQRYRQCSEADIARSPFGLTNRLDRFKRPYYKPKVV